jgi:hypothetical protein
VDLGPQHGHALGTPERAERQEELVPSLLDLLR